MRVLSWEWLSASLIVNLVELFVGVLPLSAFRAARAAAWVERRQKPTPLDC